MGSGDCNVTRCVPFISKNIKQRGTHLRSAENGPRPQDIFILVGIIAFPRQSPNNVSLSRWMVRCGFPILTVSCVQSDSSRNGDVFVPSNHNCLLCMVREPCVRCELGFIGDTYPTSDGFVEDMQPNLLSESKEHRSTRSHECVECDCGTRGRPRISGYDCATLVASR